MSPQEWRQQTFREYKEAQTGTEAQPNKSAEVKGNKYEFPAQTFIITAYGESYLTAPLKAKRLPGKYKRLPRFMALDREFTVRYFDRSDINRYRTLYKGREFGALLKDGRKITEEAA